MGGSRNPSESSGRGRGDGKRQNPLRSPDKRIKVGKTPLFKRSEDVYEEEKKSVGDSFKNSAKD